MDIRNHLHDTINAMAPADLVAHQIPQFLVPAHSAALVIIPDPTTGGQRQYGWYTGACCRIRYHDMLAINNLVLEKNVPPAVHEAMFRYLSEASGGDTPAVDHERMRIGSDILSYYHQIGIEDQIFWLCHDILTRRVHMQPLYYSRLDHLSVPAMNLTLERELDPQECEALALNYMLLINLQQQAHATDVIVSLLALLPVEKMARIAVLCRVAMPALDEDCTPPQAQVLGAPSWAHQTLGPPTANVQIPAPVQSAPTSVRPPLATVPANVQAPGLVRQTTTLKRKRQDPAPKKMHEVIDLLEESEDEDSLQSQVDALQAKIAAIRQRNASEDQVVPNKKAKSSRKSAVIPRQNVSSSFRMVDTAAQAVPRIAKQQNAVTPVSSTVLPLESPPSFQGTPGPANTQSGVAANQANIAPALGSIAAREEQRRLRESLLASVARKSQQKTHPVERNAFPSPTQEPVIRGRSSAHVSTPVVDLTSSERLPQSQRSNQPRPAHAALGHQAVLSDQPTLCKEQQEVVDCIMAGHNVFYTGSAGCGKSTVLKTFVPLLRQQGKTVKIVAPTGKAALDINGSTTWTFAGWTPLHMKRPLEQLLKAAHGKFVRQRLRDTDVLVIDEISMVENHIFARLNAIMKEAREDPRAFGGVQLVVTGDFCQLPPVKPFQYCMHCGREQPQRIVDKSTIVYRCPVHGDCRDEDKWAFRSAAWEECGFKHVNLTNIHRQSDEVFIKVLQKLRIGTALTETDRRLLLDHPCDTTNAVKLFPTRDQVKRINQTEFDRLTSPKHSYTCLDLFSWNKDKHPHLESKGNRSPFDDSLDALREHRLDTFVEYKKDMMVVLLVNLDINAGLVNGSQGRIVGFEPYDEAKLPKANRNGPGGSSLSSRYGSSHKKRWQRDSSAEPEGYGSKGELRGEYAFLREAQIRLFINNGRNRSKMWPIVEFDNGQKRTIYADCQVNELGDEREYTLLARTQIPLIAAWAMTVSTMAPSAPGHRARRGKEADERGYVYVMTYTDHGADPQKPRHDSEQSDCRPGQQLRGRSRIRSSFESQGS